LKYPFVFSILYALFIVWTGLLRSIEAQTFKPNAFYFCLATALIAIVGAFLFRAGKKWPAVITILVATLTVLVFYVNCFITQPEQDATVRVALAIVASIGELCVVASAIFGRAPREGEASAEPVRQAR
jgi:peptidoglycan/LPS O-acetylase OafA/YrhL